MGSELGRSLSMVLRGGGKPDLPIHQHPPLGPLPQSMSLPVPTACDSILPPHLERGNRNKRAFWGDPVSPRARVTIGLGTVLLHTCGVIVGSISAHSQKSPSWMINYALPGHRVLLQRPLLPISLLCPGGLVCSGVCTSCMCVCRIRDCPSCARLIWNKCLGAPGPLGSC